MFKLLLHYVYIVSLYIVITHILHSVYYLSVIKLSFDCIYDEDYYRYIINECNRFTAIEAGHLYCDNISFFFYNSFLLLQNDFDCKSDCRVNYNRYHLLLLP